MAQRVTLQRGGGVREWLMRAVLKTAVPQGTVGSNPTPSATSPVLCSHRSASFPARTSRAGRFPRSGPCAHVEIPQSTQEAGMRRPLRISPVFLVPLMVAITVLWATGCSRDESSITAPKYTATQTSGVQALKLDSPAVMAAMSSQDRPTAALLRQAGILGTGIAADPAGKPALLGYTE